METKYHGKQLTYTGKELRSLFIYHDFHLQGDALVAFQGPCKVSIKDLVDQEDVKAQAPIFSRLMVHFLGEFFRDDLEKTVMRQRLLMACILDVLRGKNPQVVWFRQGDDIYVGAKKVSVSIATRTPVSTVIHAGINVISQGTPVETFGLKEAGIDPKEFAIDVLNRFKQEAEGIALACCKVRGVP